MIVSIARKNARYSGWNAGQTGFDGSPSARSARASMLATVSTGPAVDDLIECASCLWLIGSESSNQRIPVVNHRCTTAWTFVTCPR